MEFANENDLPDIMTLEETAAYLRQTEMGFRKQLTLRNTPASYRQGKRRMFLKADVLAWRDARTAA